MSVSQETKNNMEEVVPIKDWLITLLILMIPLVNVVMMFVWAFGGGVNPNKSNFFKAQLIVFSVLIVLWFLLFASLFSSLMNSI